MLHFIPGSSPCRKPGHGEEPGYEAMQGMGRSLGTRLCFTCSEDYSRRSRAHLAVSTDQVLFQTSEGAVV